MKPTRERSYVGLLWALAVSGTLLDQLSKYSVFRWLYDGRNLYGEHEIIPGVFKLLVQFTGEQDTGHGFWAALRTLSGDMLPRVNHGALFGLGGEYLRIANAVFAVVSFVAAVAIVFWSRRPATARDLPLCTSLGLILAGTLGNLYDRLVFHGVRDFLYFYWIEWPVFNVADCCLVCGAALLLTQAFRPQPVPARHEKPQVPHASEMAEAS